MLSHSTYIFKRNILSKAFISVDCVSAIKKSHRRDVEIGDENNTLTDVIDVVKEFAVATDPMKAKILFIL